MTWLQNPAMKSNWYLRHMCLVLLYAYRASYFLFIQHKKIPVLYVLSLGMWYAITKLSNLSPKYVFSGLSKPTPGDFVFANNNIPLCVIRMVGVLW